MRRAPCSLLLLAVAPLAAQSGDAARAPRAFVAVDAPHDEVFVGAAIRLRVRFGFERAFLAEHVIQTLHQRLDVPARVDAPWLRGLAGARVVPSLTAVEGATFVLGDAIARAERTGTEARDGASFAVFAFEHVLVAVRVGDLELGGTELRFSHATRFTENLLDGRVPVDRVDAVVRSAPLALRVLPLPEAGRPADFGGAVGTFAITAEAEPRELALGASLALNLRITGDGDLAAFDAPRVDALAGFHVLGTIEERGRDARAITYDLAPLADAVAAVPPVAFTFFDPTPPGAYRTIATAPIPIRVSPGADGARRVAPWQPVAGADDVFEAVVLPHAEVARVAPALALVAVLAPWVLAALLLRWSNARRAALRDPAGLRARRAARAFARSAGRGDAGSAFADYLAARLGCSAPAVTAPQLGARLRAAGVPEALAMRTASSVEALVHARHGGPAVDAAATARPLVAELERAFAGAEVRA